MNKVWALLGEALTGHLLKDGPFESDDRRELCQYYVRDVAEGTMSADMFLHKVTKGELGYLIGAAAVMDVRMARRLAEVFLLFGEAKAAKPAEEENGVTDAKSIAEAQKEKVEEKPSKKQEELVEEKIEEPVEEEKKEEKSKEHDIKVDPEKVGDSFALADFGKPSSSNDVSSDETPCVEKTEEGYNIDDIFK